MKVVILAGGMGTRMGNETEFKPKPMAEIGGKPILWHIMNHFSYYGFNEFVVCLGYKGDVIRDYFLNYKTRNSDFTVDTKSGVLKFHDALDEDWKVTLAETGDDTPTGGRLVQVIKYLPDSFMLTYGDGLSNVNIPHLLDAHEKMGKYCTVTAVQAASRFGELDIEFGEVKGFKEKIMGDGGWINGGFFVMEPEIWEYVGKGIDALPLETGLLSDLTNDNQLGAYLHDGFWKCCDTQRELQEFNKMYEGGNPPWIEKSPTFW